ncbi:MAG: transposase [Dokdonella sp.]
MWEGRYKVWLVERRSYVLRCHRDIDLKPLRVRMTHDPTAFPWSSCSNYCGQRVDCILTPHPAYTALGAPPPARADAYRQLLHETLSEDDLMTIHNYLQQQRTLGRDDFRAKVEAKTRRFAGVRPAHRPPRNKWPQGR